MLTVFRDDFGNIQLACEWHRVDINGKIDDEGIYIYIGDLHISKFSEGTRLIRKLISDIADKVPEAVGAYWERESTNMKPHGYKRQQLTRG